jgi:hypothetical protein
MTTILEYVSWLQQQAGKLVERQVLVKRLVAGIRISRCFGTGIESVRKEHHCNTGVHLGEDFGGE